MKVFKIILSVIICLLIIAVMIFANYSGFSHVKVQVKRAGGETLVYRDLKGSYSQTEDAINKINYDMKTQFKVEPIRGFGIYFDNPRSVEENKLRSEAGSILENADTTQLLGIKEKFNVKVCPVKEYITAEFPFKGKMSIMIGLVKVYPALLKYVKANGYSEAGPIMEIYDMPNNKILYRKEAVKVVR